MNHAVDPRNATTPPGGVRCLRHAHETRYGCLWFCGWSLSNAMAAAVFGGMVCYVAWFANKNYGQLMTPTVWGAYGLALAGLAYYAASGLFNRTWITYRDEWITVWHGPLPWLGSRRLPTVAVKEVQLRRKTHRTRNLKRDVHYLEAVLHNGKTIRLMSGVFPKARFEYVRQELARKLAEREDAARPSEEILLAAERGQFSLGSLFVLMATAAVLIWLGGFFAGRDGLLVAVSVSLLLSLLFRTHGDVTTGMSLGWILIGLPAMVATMLPADVSRLTLVDPVGKVLFCLANSGLLAGSLHAVIRNYPWFGFAGIVGAMALTAAAFGMW